MSIVGGIVFFLRALLWNRAAIAAESLVSLSVTYHPQSGWLEEAPLRGALT